jgi:hypothetical protein
VYLPIGLLGAALGRARDEDMLDTMNAIGREIDRRRAWAAHDEASRELHEACTGEGACLVYLGANSWDGFAIDGVLIDRPQAPRDAPPAGYREPARRVGAGPHGFFGVCAGRHVVRARVGAALVKTAFLAYPGEAVLLELDPVAGAWAQLDEADSREVVARYAAGDLGLLDYHAWVAERRLADGLAKRSQKALLDAHALAIAALEAAERGRVAEVARLAGSAGAALDGVPLASFGAITSAFGFIAFELLAHGDVARAARAIDVALTILPDDATLLAVSGEIALRADQPGDARARLELAVARGAVGLDATWRARAAAALASIS